jgi:hypothetical protein
MNRWRVQVLIVAGALVVVAVAALLLWPKLKSSPVAAAANRSQQVTNLTAAAANPGVTNVATNASPGPDNLPKLDRRAILERWPEWVEGRYRDPFQVVFPVSTGAVAQAELTPARHLKLSATWVQTGSRLAVIDQRVYGVGDKVAGYTVLQIEHGRVDLQGPERNETITFATYVPPPPPGQGGLISTNLIEKLLGPEQERLRN